eukprot:6595505-Ditylum_brightwellii.AAC.1
MKIAFMNAALNSLDICAAEICNAYLQTSSLHKDYIICDPEFGIENIRKVALVHHALYGGKTVGHDFRNHLRSCMQHLDFKFCPADLDVWMRPTKYSDSSKHYEYTLLYIDDALVIGEFDEKLLHQEIVEYFTLNEESIRPPKIYLGSHVRKVKLNNGVECWAFSSLQYVQVAVKNIEEYLTHPGN